MNYIKLTNQIIDYIEANLKDNIDIDEVSSRFSISKYYLVRIFKALTNYTVKEYIDKRKMTEAAKQIIKSDRKIIDIAFDSGYESHEVFTRTFKKIFSITPMELRKNGYSVSGYEQIKVVERDFKNSNKDLIVKFRLVHCKELKLYGESTRFDLNNSHSISKITPFVKSFVSNHIEKAGITRMYNVVVNEKNAENQHRYFAGFHNDNIIKQPVHLKELLVRESDYAVFRYGADLADIHKTVMNDICRTILLSELSINKTNVEFFLVFEDDYFDTKQYDIYVPVKK